MELHACPDGTLFMVLSEALLHLLPADSSPIFSRFRAQLTANQR